MTRTGTYATCHVCGREIRLEDGNVLAVHARGDEPKRCPAAGKPAVNPTREKAR